MREQLIQYVNLLFAGAQDSDEVRTEILQNTLDRYDDLIAQGKSPEAAYRLAITGIGDVNEILGTTAVSDTIPVQNQTKPIREIEDDPKAKKMRAIAIAMYILCPVPLFILSEFNLPTLGLCLTIALVAAATYVIVICGKKDTESYEPEECKKVTTVTPNQKLKESIRSLIGALTLAVYLVVSFATGVWEITWLIFPISGCIKGLINAIVDLKEARKNEN